MTDTTVQPMPDSQPKARPSLDGLTGVRFLAAFQVVLFHFGAGFARRRHFPAPLTHFLSNGWISVSLFFILSGFILSYTYSGRMDSWADRWRFWKARFARIYPVYILSLLLCLPFTVLKPGLTIATLCMVQGWNPLHPEFAGFWNMPAWTLSCEAFFYLFFPFLFPVIRSASVRALRAFAAALVLFIVFAHTMTNWPAAWLHSLLLPLPAVRLPEFLLGITAASLFVRQRPLRKAPLLAVASAILIVALEMTISGPWISLAVVPFIVLIYSLACGTGSLARLLSTKTLVFLGGASYSIYLLQEPVRKWTHVIFSPHRAVDGIDTILSPFILLVFSSFVFVFWEEPARKWLRNRFDPRKTRQAPAPVAEVIFADEALPSEFGSGDVS